MPAALPAYRHDPPDSRLLLCAGALLGLGTVAAAALAAHLPERAFAPGGRALLRTAVEMQGWHVPALLACGLLLRGAPRPAARWLLRAAGLLFVCGIGGFATGLSGLAFAAIAPGGALAHLAPFGGSLLMLGWLGLAIGCALPARR